MQRQNDSYQHSKKKEWEKVVEHDKEGIELTHTIQFLILSVTQPFIFVDLLCVTLRIFKLNGKLVNKSMAIYLRLVSFYYQFYV